MLQLKLEFKNITPLAAKLGGLKEEIAGITRDPGFLKSTGQLLASRGKQNLEDGGHGGKSYELLAQSTRKEKARNGYSLKPLQRTGIMKQSLEYEVSQGLYMTGVDYIKYHQSDQPRKKLPQRKVFTVEDDDLLDIQDFLIRRFERKIQS